MRPMRSYFEAPDPYEPAPGDPPAVFLAGGITGVEDWQRRAAAALGPLGVIVLNPRRREFPIGDPAQTPVQITWEHRHLHLPGVLTMFWFPAGDSVQPIAMLELGAALDNPARRMVVGADPGYPRVEDVRWQTRLARPDEAVHSTLDDTLAAVRARLPF
ncbi:nucleoside 2-deoxyribosyltransferase domain-containing protein [Nonomuraea sp. SYSU D8015]|uniref:nucleoside 2-deoxyribosyltransferase domain-containing protein n=1 Tax=Nonomuraea sp. SYSU D8015 TaxID=2593644 RepID=UPI0016608CDF|nr:nucleoside 2-deoxyribosyltransferase domain-containing protein [Nonomuraea sp. SYSU D8015]